MGQVVRGLWGLWGVVAFFTVIGLPVVAVDAYQAWLTDRPRIATLGGLVAFCREAVA